MYYFCYNKYKKLDISKIHTLTTQIIIAVQIEQKIVYKFLIKQFKL